MSQPDRIRTRFPSYVDESEGSGFAYREERRGSDKETGVSAKYASLKSPWFFIIFAASLYATLWWEPIVCWNNRFLGVSGSPGSQVVVDSLADLGKAQLIGRITANTTMLACKPPTLTFWNVLLAVFEAYVISRYLAKRRHLPLLALRDPYFYFLALLEHIEGNKLAFQMRDLAKLRRRSSEKRLKSTSRRVDGAPGNRIGPGALIRATMWWWAFAFLAHRTLTRWSQTSVAVHVGLFGDAVAELLALFEARWLASYLTPRRTYFVYYFRFLRKTLFSGPQGLLLTSTAVAAYITARVIPLMFGLLYETYSSLSTGYPLLAIAGLSPLLVLLSFAGGLALMAALNAGLLLLFSFSLTNSLYGSLLMFLKKLLFSNDHGKPRIKGVYAPASAPTARGSYLHQGEKFGMRR